MSASGTSCLDGFDVVDTFVPGTFSDEYRFASAVGKNGRMSSFRSMGLSEMTWPNIDFNDICFGPCDLESCAFVFGAIMACFSSPMVRFSVTLGHFGGGRLTSRKIGVQRSADLGTIAARGRGDCRVTVAARFDLG